MREPPVIFGRSLGSTGECRVVLMGRRSSFLMVDLSVDGALQSVARGDVFLSPAVSGFLLNRLRRQEQLASARPDLLQLTPMEVRVLKLIGENRTNEEIARQLFISPHTVHTHRNNMCAKLDLHGTRGLLVFALEHKDVLQKIKLIPRDST